MNKFNLTFSGEILSDRDPGDVRLRFAEAFSIDDPQRLERFFSGDTIILRRNLERKAAAQCYQEMRDIGVVAELVKIPPEQLAQEERSRQRRHAQQQARRAAEEAERRRLEEERRAREAAEAAARREREAELRRQEEERRLESVMPASNNVGFRSAYLCIADFKATGDIGEETGEV
ncbi:MAG: hypothetical protein R3228_07180, partial [Halioglobus sp.]|nr:hypothetical protein [Halioglobus sp.]